MNLLKAISLACFFLLGLGLTALGLAALQREIRWAGSVGDTNWLQLRVDEGNLHLLHARQAAEMLPRGRDGITLFRGNFGRLGFYRGNDRQWRWVSASLPLWLVVGLLVIPSGAGIVRGPLRRRYRLRRGLCLRCGYDVSRCVGERCSECGTAIRRTDRHRDAVRIS